MLKKKFEENKKEIVATATVLTVLGVGFIFGRRYQRSITVSHLQDAITFTKVANPMFPDAMPLAEIKEVLSTIDGAEFFDALVVNLNGVQSLLTRGK